MAFGTDYTPVGPMPTDIVLGDVDATSMRLARDIRDKGHGIDTRETMARMILKSSTMHNHLIKVNNALKVQNDEYYRQFTDVMKELSKDQDYYSLPEISGARGGFDTLGERLNHFAQTFSDGSPSIFYDTLAELKSAYPNGADGIALVGETDPAKIYVWNGSAWKDYGDYQGLELKDGAVTLEKLNFTPVLGEMGKNLFNKKTVIPGNYISSTTGELRPQPIFTTSDFIKLLPNTTYTKNTILYSAFYDINGTFISGLGEGVKTFTTPPNTYYGRFTFYNTEVEQAQIELGSKSTQYEKFGGKIEKNSLDFSNVRLTWGVILDKDICITVDLQSRKVILNKNFNIQAGHTTPEVSGNQPDIDISGTTDDYTRYCYYDLNEEAIKYVSNVTVPDNPHVLLFIKRFNTIWTLSPDNIQLIKPDGSIGKNLSDTVRDVANIQNSINNNDTRYDELEQRLIIPSEMYFVDDVTLPIYKASIMASKRVDNVRTAIVNESIPRFQYFNDDISLKATELDDTFKIGLTPKFNSAHNYFKNITKRSVDRNINAGKTVKILSIGDSLTNRDLPPMLKSKLAEYDVSANMIGTMNNGGENGEGREAWGFDHFVGRDNIAAIGKEAIHPTTTKNSLNDNPFLKIATEIDKENHPEWCFRNTGVGGADIYELSYAEDNDKTGDFYIFDLQHYLINQGLENPDVITIGLGTNDIGQNPTTWLDSCKLGLEIMVSQIKACLPDCKIGIVPVPQMSSVYDVWYEKHTKWIDACMKEVEVLQTNYSNLSIIPVWCHMNKDWNFPYNTPVDIAETSSEKKAEINDVTHFGTSGKMEYINVSSAWVMNVI